MADFPVVPDDVLLMIAREYCLATVENGALDGWWTVNAEMQTIIPVPQTKADYQRQGVLDPQVWKPVGARDRLLLVEGD